MTHKNTPILLALLLGTLIPSLHASLVDEESSKRGQTKRESSTDLKKRPAKRIDQHKKETASSSLKQDSDSKGDESQSAKILPSTPLSKPHLSSSTPLSPALAFDASPQDLIPFTDTMNNLPQGTVAPMEALIAFHEDEIVSRNRFEGLLTDIDDLTFNENHQPGSSIFTKFFRALETGYFYHNDSYWTLDESMWNIETRLSTLRKVSALARRFHDEAGAESGHSFFNDTHAILMTAPKQDGLYHSFGLINRKQFQEARLTQDKQEIANAINYLYIKPLNGMITFDFKHTLMESLKGSMIRPGSLPREDSRTRHKGSFVDPISGRFLNLDVKLDYEAELDNALVQITLFELMNDDIHWSVKLTDSTDETFTYSIHLNDHLETRLGHLTVSIN